MIVIKRPNGSHGTLARRRPPRRPCPPTKTRTSPPRNLWSAAFTIAAASSQSGEWSSGIVVSLYIAATLCAGCAGSWLTFFPVIELGVSAT